MSIDKDLFRAVLGRFATGVTIVTVCAPEGRPHGMTVSAFASVSLDPTLVLICIDKNAALAPLLPDLEHFAVNVLTSEQEELSRRFANDLDDRFDGIGYTLGKSGAPLIDNTLAWLECRVVERHPAGDHVIVIGEVVRAEAHSGSPLLYFRGGYARLER